MEIERKFLVDKIPADLEKYSHKELEQGYLCREPVVRVRREGEAYVLTYKSKGLMVREEYNLPLNKEAYEHLKIELDIFHGKHEGLILAEVEFASEEEANQYCPPEWFGEEVTFSSQYHNSVLSME